MGNPAPRPGEGGDTTPPIPPSENTDLPENTEPPEDAEPKERPDLAKRMEGPDVPAALHGIGLDPGKFADLLHQLSGDAVSSMTIWKYGRAYITRVPPGLVCFIRLMEHLAGSPDGRRLLNEHPVIGKFYKEAKSHG